MPPVTRIKGSHLPYCARSSTPGCFIPTGFKYSYARHRARREEGEGRPEPCVQGKWKAAVRRAGSLEPSSLGRCSPAWPGRLRGGHGSAASGCSHRDRLQAPPCHLSHHRCRSKHTGSLTGTGSGSSWCWHSPCAALGAPEAAERSQGRAAPRGLPAQEARGSQRREEAPINPTWGIVKFYHSPYVTFILHSIKFYCRLQRIKAFLLQRIRNSLLGRGGRCVLILGVAFPGSLETSRTNTV